MNVLVTGARAPSCLEISRKIKADGHGVYVSDCTSLTLTRFSNRFDGYLNFASPRFEFGNFKNDIERFIQAKKIEMVIPTCEEVFYLSKLKTLVKDDIFFCDNFQKIKKLHSKLDFAKLSSGWSLQTPETFPVQSFEDWKSMNQQSKDFVFKPVYSRFAAHTLIDPCEGVLRKYLDAGFPWVAQRRVYGSEICLYALCVYGKVTAFSAYRPVYRAGLGAGVYLEPFFNEALVQFVESFASEQKYHGQVAFDIMQSSVTGKFQLLECNPRATSGIHFFGPEIFKAVTGENKNIIFGDRLRPRMVAAAVLIYAAPWSSFQWSRWRKFYYNYAKASDVVWDSGDIGPYLGQYLSFAAFMAQAVIRGESAIVVSSRDIEYNG